MSAVATGRLLERDRELRVLADAISGAREGRGRSVVLQGPAGIGKTELMRAAVRAARSGGARVVLARGSEFERAFAFGVVRQLFEPLVAETPRDEREVLFAGAARFAREAIAPAAGDGPGETAFATLHGLYWLCVNLADTGPLVLAVDDLQWVDAASLRWISFLARRIEGLPVLLLATLRTDGAAGPDGAIDDLVVNRLADTVRPAALSEQAVAMLVERELGAEPDPRFTRACHEATRGNPLFLRELLAALRLDDVRPTARAAGRVETIGPRAVTRLVLARLAGLGPIAEHLARVAALVGDGAEPEVVRGVAQVDAAQFAAAAHRLGRADLVAFDPRVAFVHPVSRAAIVAAIEPAERATLSRRAATLLAERGDHEGVASHLLAVPPTGDQQAVAALRRAGGRALARGAPETAVALLQRALVEPPAGEDEADVLHSLGLAELRTHATLAPVHLHAALGLRPPGARRARVADDLARALHSLNRSDEALEVAETALSELGPEATPERARLIARTVELARFLGDHAGVVRRMAEAEAASADPALIARVRGIGAYDAMLAGTAAGEVAALAHRALGDGALAEDPDGSMPLFLACMALASAGDVAAASAALERAIETAGRRGSVVSYTGALSIRARLRLMSGDLRGAEADAREIEELGDEGLGSDYVTGWLVESLVEQGRLDEAEAVVAGRPLAADPPALIVFNPGLHARGRLRMAQGRLGAGLADALLCGERQEAVGAHNPADVPWRATAALALQALGRHDEADAMSSTHLAAASSFGAPAVVAHAERVRGTVLGGVEGRELLEHAAGLIDARTAPLELAHTLLAVGRARHDAGDGAGAREALQQARELAETCGAAPLVAAAIEGMITAGGRPRRTRASGRAALTPAERRTVRQAAGGLSNREIAQASFVTEKTVEGHLSSAYRKLRITSRSQLAAALEAVDDA